MPFKFLTGSGGSSLVPGATGIRLIQPGLLSGGTLVTFSRAQIDGVTSFATDGGGSTWVEYPADLQRFTGTAQGMLFEGDRTNGIRNPRGNIAVATPTTSRPTNWTNVNTAGITPNYTATPTNLGIPCVRVQLSTGSAAATTFAQSFDTTTAVAAVSGDVVFGTAFVRLEAAPTAPLTYFIRLQARDSGGTVLGGGTTTQTYTPTGTLTRISVNATMPASTAFVTLEYGATLTAAAAYDFTQDFGAPQIEVAAPFASSPTINRVGQNSIANVRGADVLYGLTSGAFPSSVGTMLAKVLIPQNAPAGADQMIFQMDDGTANNRIRLRNVAGGATIVAGRVVSGTPTDATSLGSMTAGTAFKVGLSWDGTNIRGNFNGGTTQSITGSAAALTNFRIGGAVSGSGLFGSIQYLDMLPYAVPDLATAVSGLP
jgi:hypothetical protein